MIVNFSALDYEEGPLLLLKNLDGTPIHPLGNACKVTANLMYNEVSELEFELPAYVNGVRTPHYDDVVGMRIVDWVGVGQFILSNPRRQSDGVKEYKTCKAYSLEYELTYKKIFIEEGTYEFWNTVAPEGTVIGMIMELLPSWNKVEVDPALEGRYRTFGVDNDSIYDFMKGTLQDTFQCIFDFDTYERKIYVRSVASTVAQRPVFLSLDNLITDISVEEDTENIFTCLDVNGADGVDIRSVNPTGTNKIYNLDYFMNPSYFSDELIDKWNSWKTTYQNYRQPYFNITIEKTLQEARLETEKAALTELEGQLQTDETMQSTYVEASAQGIDMTTDLADIKASIAQKNAYIDAKKALIKTITDDIDELYKQQRAINAACSLSTFFGEADMTLLDRYIKEDSISEDSFVYRSVASYTESDVAKTVQTVSAYFAGGTVTRVQTTSGKEIYSIIGGTLSMKVDDDTVSSSVVRGAVERANDGGYIVTAYLGAGTYRALSFPSGCVSLVGNASTVETDVIADPDISGSYKEGTSVTVNSETSNLYFTMNATEYAKRSIEWDLLEYGQQCLDELSYPSYTFKLDSSNFLSLEEFRSFKNKFQLGSRVYLEMSEDEHLTPIVIGAEIECDDPSKLSLVFGDKYSAGDSAFSLVDLLEESISMGKTVASNITNFNAFIDSGASTAVQEFISGTLDASRNAVLSSENQDVRIDQTGIRLREALPEGGFADEQIWMTKNNIVFTDDGWDSAKLAIGNFTDVNTGANTCGIVAPSIVGTLLAGKNLVIESEKKDGGVAVFRVGSEGAALYNSRFDLVNEYGVGQSGHISMMPPVGLVGGNVTSTTPLFSYDEDGNVTGVMTAGGNSMTDLRYLSSSDLPNANFWLDMLGNAFFKGTVYATDGRFTGAVYATSGEFSGALKAATLEGTLLGVNGGAIKGVSLGIGGKNYNNFVVDSDGNVTMRGNINLSSGNITWGSNVPDAGLTENEVIDLIDQYGATVPNYIRSTYINSTEIRSPEITGNNISVYGSFQTLSTSGDPTGFMGAAYGMTASGDTTYGVALSSDYNNAYNLGNCYVIVTDSGVRLQAFDHTLVLTSTGVRADGNLIGSSSSVTAVWGA